MSGWTVNDLEPPLTGVISNGALPVDLSAASAVVVNIRRADNTYITNDAVKGDQETSPGSWSMPWFPDDLNVSGPYAVEVEVMWPGDRPQTFGPALVRVFAEIAAPPVIP